MFQDLSSENDIHEALLQNDDFSIDDEDLFEDPKDDELAQAVEGTDPEEEDVEDDENPLFDSHDDQDLM